MNNESRRRLLDAQKACELIRRFTAGHTFEEYDVDVLLSSAVERQFKIVGEALKLADSADETVADRVPDLRRIVGLRNRIIHGYDAVDNLVIWRIVQDDLPRLAGELDAALR